MRLSPRPALCYAGVRLEALLAMSRYTDIRSIITAPDSWVHKHCLQRHLPVQLIDRNDRESAFRWLTEQRTAVVFSAGFPFVIPADVLNCGKHFINSHPSLLPDYRGYSPIKAAFRNRERFMGVTVHWMGEEVDAGPVIWQERVLVEGLELERVYELMFSVVEPFVISKAFEALFDGQ